MTITLTIEVLSIDHSSIMPYEVIVITEGVNHCRQFSVYSTQSLTKGVPYTGTLHITPNGNRVFAPMASDRLMS